jgi:hypothetical protein
MAALLTADVGPVPNEPRLSTRYPHRLAVRAVGAAYVPVVAAIVLLPETKLVDAFVSATDNVYPEELFVLTVMVSLAVDCTPEPVGVAFSVTVPLVVNTLIVEPIVLVIVVDCVSASTFIGNTTANNKPRLDPAITFVD